MGYLASSANFGGLVVDEEMIATQLANLSMLPNPVPYHGTVEFSGNLEYNNAGVWVGMSGRPVVIKKDGVVVTTVTTGAAGLFGYTLGNAEPTDAGTYTAEYAGE